MLSSLPRPRRRQLAAVPAVETAPVEAPHTPPEAPSRRTLYATATPSLDEWEPRHGAPVVVHAELNFEHEPQAGTVIVMTPGLPSQGGTARSLLRLADFRIECPDGPLDSAKRPKLAFAFGCLDAAHNERPTRFAQGGPLPSVFVLPCDNDLSKGGVLAPVDGTHVEWRRVELAFGLQVVTGAAKWCGTGKRLVGTFTFEATGLQSLNAAG